MADGREGNRSPMKDPLTLTGPDSTHVSEIMKRWIMRIRNKRRFRRHKPKRKLRQHPAYTVAALQKKNNAELVVIAKALGVDYRLASGEKKKALEQIISYIAELVEGKRK